jgi:hypothetical protein
MKKTTVLSSLPAALPLALTQARKMAEDLSQMSAPAFTVPNSALVFCNRKMGKPPPVSDIEPF